MSFALAAASGRRALRPGGRPRHCARRVSVDRRRARRGDAGRRPRGGVSCCRASPATRASPGSPRSPWRSPPWPPTSAPGRANCGRSRSTRRAASDWRSNARPGRRRRPGDQNRNRRRRQERTGRKRRASPPGGEGAGWGWINWVRDGLRGGTIPVNAAGGWLHNIAGEAYVVVPDGFAAFAAILEVEASTVKNRVALGPPPRAQFRVGRREHVPRRTRRRPARRGHGVSGRPGLGRRSAARGARRVGPQASMSARDRDGSPQGRELAREARREARQSGPEGDRPSLPTGSLAGWWNPKPAWTNEPRRRPPRGRRSLGGRTGRRSALASRPSILARCSDGRPPMQPLGVAGAAGQGDAPDDGDAGGDGLRVVCGAGPDPAVDGPIADDRHRSRGLRISASRPRQPITSGARIRRARTTASPRRSARPTRSSASGTG